MYKIKYSSNANTFMATKEGKGVKEMVICLPY